MAAKILVARDTGTSYHIVIWLDSAKVLADGATPDARYVAEWDFAKWDGATGGSLAGYRAQITSEVKLLAADGLARINAPAGVALAIEGTTF